MRRRVSVVSPRDGERTASSQVEFAIDIAAREGGIGRVEWRINGITIGVDQPAAPAAGQPLAADAFACCWTRAKTRSRRSPITRKISWPRCRPARR